VGLGQPDQPISLAPFCECTLIRDSRSTSWLAAQLLPRRAKVARMVSPVTLLIRLSLPRNSPRLPYLIVHKVLSLPNSLGERWSNPCRASAFSPSNVAWVRFGREESAMRASRPRRLKSWMASRTVCELHPKFLAIWMGSVRRESLQEVSGLGVERAKAPLERRSHLQCLALVV
jgi:hypothetical protein